MRIEASEKKIQDAVDKILARREFQQSNRKNPVSDMINRLWDGIREWIERQLFQGRRQQRDIEIDPEWFSIFEIVAKIVLLIIAAVIVFFLIRFLIKKIYLPKKSKKVSHPNAYDAMKDPERVLDELEALLAKHEYTCAILYLFIATLLVFHKRKTIHIEKWKTNRMYVREVKSNDTENAAAMQEFTMLYNASCYGGKTVDEAQINKWLTFYKKLKGGTA